MTWKAMNEVVRGRQLRNESAYTAALIKVTQKKAAELIDVSDTTISDNKDMIVKSCLIFAAVGLRLVPIEEKTISPDAYKEYHRERIRNSERELAEMGETRPGELT